VYKSYPADTPVGTALMYDVKIY